MKYSELFSPISIGNVKIKNRFAMAPMGPLGLADTDGGFNQRGIDYYVERAKGGTGLIITGVSFVDEEVEHHGSPTCPSSTMNPLHFIRTSKEMTERIHAYGAKVFYQMSAGFGRVSIPNVIGEHDPVAPSVIPHRFIDRNCRAITKEEVKMMVRKFGEGAVNCKKAGFDGVQIHAVHEGYLLDQFAIAFFNHREDEYGGSLENRLRFAKEIVEEIKRRCGEDFVVTLRYSPKSFIKDWRKGGLPGEVFEEKGRDIEEGKEAAKLLVEYGYDALDVDVGSYDAWYWSHPPMYQEKGLYRPYAKIMKEVVNVPIICAGRMDNPKMALEAIQDGTCDMISLGRPLLADPDYANKIRTGRVDQIRPCISCQEGCMGRIQEYSLINCAVNPLAGREAVTHYKPICKPKKVMIVGGGLAGCEVARVLAIRGHKPTIFEKTDKLGGVLHAGGAPSFKEDDILLANWYSRQIELLDIPVLFNTVVDKDMIKNSEDFDVLILATGSKAKVFSLGCDEKTFEAMDVLLGKKDVGNSTAIIGGGLVGCELALHLRELGKEVTIVEALEDIILVNGPTCHANHDMLHALIPFKGINTIFNAKAKSYDGKTLNIDTKEGSKSIDVDSVILATGYISDQDLYKQVEEDIPEIYLLGDSKNVSNIMYAIWDAFEVGNNI
ncbi:FAD-dependent oxidoreductase [Peptostreptococcus equinus]|uniref:FAD-dependent oxidoreductase n=1 Tax=Peptostreptococcus equinus TaxID=3003601 RepID=A0ABY7JSR4_9FIRM|nr:FAD-dependent oxidoreductase [Peptostreptococcus sp. CBA3647]WAW15203.1 FAD-dependent oxidoreductase [Peptostreptococcus sp. CBA3647]